MMSNSESKNIDFVQSTLKRMKYIPMFAVLFLVSNYFFPLAVSFIPYLNIL